MPDQTMRPIPTGEDLPAIGPFSSLNRLPFIAHRKTSDQLNLLQGNRKPFPIRIHGP